MSDNSSDLGAFLAGFVIGGLIGAATALILAPQSGEATRDQIKSQGSQLATSGESFVQQYREQANSLTQPIMDKANNASSNVQEQARIVLDKGREQVNKVRGQASGSVENSHNGTEEAS